MVLAQLDLLVMWGEAMLSRNYFAELRYKLKIGWPNQGAEKLRQTKYFNVSKQKKGNPTRRVLSVSMVLFFCISLYQGCRTIGESTGRGQAEEKTLHSIPYDSIFAKIKVGMGYREVQDLIGHPTDSEWFHTGKAYNPFYFGHDTVRTVHYYKGEGRIIFSGNERVIRIEYDPDENGYR